MKRLILVVTFILAAIGALLAVFAPVFTPDTEASTSNTYRVGMVEDVTTLNVWKYLATDQSVFNSYVIDGLHPSLYRLSDQRFDWVPYLADGFPTAFQQESVATTTFWTSQITLKQGVLWSDGSQFDANDVVFTIETIVDFQLSGNWSTLLDRNVFDHAEVVDSRTVKMYFKQKPVLGQWQFGVGVTPIMQSAFWLPKVNDAKNAGDLSAQQTALYAIDVSAEPTTGPFKFSQRTPGSFIELVKNENYFFTGSR